MGCFPGNSGMSRRTKFPFVHKNKPTWGLFRILKQVNQEPLQGQLDFDPSNGSAQWFLMTQKQLWPWPEQKQLPHRGQSHPHSPPCSSACRLASIPRSSSRRHQRLRLRTSDSFLCWLNFGKFSSLNKAGGLSISRNLPTEHFTISHLLAGYLIL